VKAAQELLGTPTIAGGECPGRGSGEGSLRRQISPQPAEIYKNGAEKKAVSSTFWLKHHENAVFCSKVLNKIYS
jgi:hypothetical protein